MTHFGRSGSALLQSLLDSHTQVSTCPGTYFSQFFDIAIWRKIAHGGFLCTIADTGMGTAAHMVSKKRCVTISLEMKFIAAGSLNQTLSGKIKVQKKTNSLVFITCEIFNSEVIVVTASGVWKIL